MIKYTPQFLKKIEEIFEENSYKIRYEKGNFKSGSCLIEDRKMIIINKFASIESRITTLLEMIRVINVTNTFTGEKFEQVNKMLAKLQREGEITGDLFDEADPNRKEVAEPAE